MKYAVVYHREGNAWGASVPDLNVFATGSSREEIRQEIRSAIAFHLEGLKEFGEAVPESTTEVEMIELTSVTA